MAAPDINLGKGEILVVQANSTLGVIPIQGNTYNFGVVAKINDLCDKVVVNDSVMYDLSKGKNFFYGSTIYILINEEFVSGVEVIPP